MIYLKFTRPTNIKTIHVKNNTLAVDKFSGNINAQIIAIGNITGTNASLKESTLSCVLDNILAVYMISANRARSEVWKVRFITGNVIQREASFTSGARNMVYNKAGTDIHNNICAIRL